MATVVKDIVNWLKQWYYTESEVDTLVGGLQTQINNKADTTTVSSLSTTVGNKADKSGGVAQITDSNSANYTNIGSLSANATQQAINSAINTRIGNLIPVDWIIVVTTLPTASASTMGRLYLVAKSGATGDNVFVEYITVKQGSAYSWEKLGELSGSGLSVDWQDITNKPSAFTPSTHSHTTSDITNLDIPSSTSDLENDGATGDYPYVEYNEVSSVGLSGAYSDLTGIPSSFTPASHTHGQVTNDGKITSTAVTVASGDNIVITDDSDSSKVKRVANLLASHIKDGTAHSNIGSSANATQATINTSIDTALGNKANASDLSGKADKTVAVDIAKITLADVGEANEGCIIFETIS